MLAVSLLLLLLLLAAGVFARSASAAGSHFERGDVLASVAGGISRYAPDGTLEATFATGSGAGALCLDPSGKYLVAPGAGLFDTSGNSLPSSWGSLSSSYGECAVDGSGHVYVAQGPYRVDPVAGRWGTIRKYDLRGNLLRSYTVSTNVAAYVNDVPNLDLAPDQCTIYYDMEGGDGIYRFNTCTNTQECPLVLQAPGCAPGAGINGLSEGDQLRVPPNWDVAMVWDHSADSYDSSGGFIRGWGSQTFAASTLRWISPDPSGTSFWAGRFGSSSCPGSGATPSNAVWQLDLSTGQVLRAWPLGCNVSLNGIATYAPPLVGNADVAGTRDSNAAGTAEAFAAGVGYSGGMSSLHLYVDSSSTATHVLIGVYSDHNGHPGSLLRQATITGLRSASWNAVQVPQMSVTLGQRLWITVLAPSGAGTIRFRDATIGLGSETSSQHGLTSLPATWSSGTTYADGGLSAYGS
jgi:hypothetical protein